MNTKVQEVVMCPLSRTDRRWLERLCEEIWEEIPGKPVATSSEKRELTEAEWQRICRIVRESELPCELYAGPHSNLWVKVFTHPESPGLEPEFFFIVGQGNLPGFSKLVGYEERHPAAWKAFSPLTHTKRNTELLKLYNLEPSREAACYEY